MQTKKCTKCLVEKTTEEFHRCKQGKYGVKSICKECVSHYHKGKINNNSKKHKKYNIIKKLKLFYKCSTCDINDNIPSLYEFHHVDRNEKEYEIGQLIKNNSIDLYKELNKCCILCANCHRKIHYFFIHNKSEYEKMLKKIKLLKIPKDLFLISTIDPKVVSPSQKTAIKNKYKHIPYKNII